jgi:2,3-bisphosphoglycerate-dependent phosphoglycerate mutase
MRILASPMRRARETVDVLLESHADSVAIFDWRLSERNYGALTGRTKSEVLEEFGPELFRLWRRSANVAPPPMSAARAVELGVDVAHFGFAESLEDVIARVRECYLDAILPTLTPERPLLVVAHGNSLRALCAVLDNLSDEEVAELNIPIGQPLLYRIDQQGINTTPGGEYLDPATALAASALIAHEGGT